MNDENEMVLSELLKQKQIGIFEAYEVRTFRIYRKSKDGGVQEVTIEILDAGPTKPGSRYHCVARAGDKSASGNSAESISTVLALVHWWDLD
jgi:hypothetical protein